MFDTSKEVLKSCVSINVEFGCEGCAHVVLGYNVCVYGFMVRKKELRHHKNISLGFSDF